MDLPPTSAAVLVCATFLCTTFLIYDLRRRRCLSNSPSVLQCAGILCHNIPALLFLAITIAAQVAHDTALVLFVALMTFQYWRTLVNIYYWIQYELAVPSADLKITPDSCTVVVTTVGPDCNAVYSDMVTRILVNRPARLIFSTNTASATEQINKTLPAIMADVETGFSTYQQQYHLDPIQVTTEIVVLNANVSNKRQQVVHAFSNVKTSILVMVDDTAIWHPQFLHATLPSFQAEKVGFVGTRKWNKRHPRPRDSKLSLLPGLWKQYVAGFWNTIGGLYLIRYNFETRATNAADGGVFCVSGRSSLIRSNIVQDKAFKKPFLNEYVFGWGPVTANNDNFITRWVINHDYDVKIQSSKEATMTTTLGTYPLKFTDQCRTTFRQNQFQLFADRTVWWKWPLTVWTTLLPWMYNAALFWDGLAVYMLTQTDIYARSSQPTAMLCSLIGFIWITKLVKTIPWFWGYPMDFPPLLRHSRPSVVRLLAPLLKIYTAFTFWDLDWSGRKLK